MNKKIVENYENLCKKSSIDIITSGRYLFSQGYHYPTYLANDIASKLELQKEDRLIDIGCNIGIYHEKLKDRVSFILGIDAGIEIIRKAKEKNNFENVDYLVLDVLDGDWSAIDGKFNKAIVYSVIHFFDCVDYVENLLRELLQVMEQKCTIMIGEVRDRQLYNEFQENKKTKRISLRNTKFMINRIINSIYINKGKPNQIIGFPCTVYDFKEIERVAAKLSLECVMIQQTRNNPFYNTCVDYVLQRK